MNRKSPIFLARAGYRVRRAMDAARFLPIVGAFLFFLPLLWEGGRTGQGVIYIFVIWLGLIIAAAMLSRPLNESQTDPENTKGKGPIDGPV